MSFFVAMETNLWLEALMDTLAFISVMTSPITFTVQQRQTEMCICCHVCALAALGEKRHIYMCLKFNMCETC